MTESVSIVYVNYHCEDLISRSLDSLLKDPLKPSAEIFVVDNGSAKTEDFWDSQPIIHLKSPGNPGFGIACNIGAARSKGDFILFLNPDTIPDPAVIDALVEHLAMHPEASACGPALVGMGGTPQVYWNFHHILSWELAEALYLQGTWRKVYEHRMERRYGRKQAWPVSFVSGACLLVRRTAFDAVGGFDERFFMNFEDFELCRRLEKLGHVHYLPWLKMVHEEGSVQRANWGDFVFFRLQAHLTYLDIAYLGPRWILARAILLKAILLRLIWGRISLRGDARTRLEGYRKALALAVGLQADQKTGKRER